MDGDKLMRELSMNQLKQKISKYLLDNDKTFKYFRHNKQNEINSFKRANINIFNYLITTSHLSTIHINNVIKGNLSSIKEFVNGNYMTKYDIVYDINKSPRTISRMLNHKGSNKYWIPNIIKIHRVIGHGLHYYNDERNIKLNKNGHTFSLGLKKPTSIVDKNSYINFMNYGYGISNRKQGYNNFSKSKLIQIIKNKSKLLNQCYYILQTKNTNKTLLTKILNKLMMDKIMHDATTENWEENIRNNNIKATTRIKEKINKMPEKTTNELSNKLLENLIFKGTQKLVNNHWLEPHMKSISKITNKRNHQEEIGSYICSIMRNDILHPKKKRKH